MHDFLAQATWTLIRTPPNAALSPAELDALDSHLILSLPATVPGTAAGSWRDEFRDPALAELDVDAWDWWYVATFSMASPVTTVAVSEGIATYSTLWLDEHQIGQSQNAFTGLAAPVDVSAGPHRLSLRCASLTNSLIPANASVTANSPAPTSKTMPASAALPSRRPRSRWRSSLVAQDSVRWHRTPLLGHIPWAGTAKTAGPWAGLRLELSQPLVVDSIQATLGDGVGVVTVSLRSQEPHTVTVSVKHQGAVVSEITALITGATELKLHVPDPALWFPAVYGTPHTYQVLVVGENGAPVTPPVSTGFRTVSIDRSHDSFHVQVNGVSTFTRGAVWAPLDPLTLSGTAEQYRQGISALIEAGATMVRVSGTGAFEQRPFYDECTQQGLLVWQDCMLATLDPPEESDWLAQFEAELDAWLPRLKHQPCLAVVCGGNEVEQQPVFFGLASGSYPMTVLEHTIPQAIKRHGMGVEYVRSSPTGGESPISIRQGVSHYFGVGAYLRGLHDARTSGVRFASESLAFAVPPEPSSLQTMFGTQTPADQDHSKAAWVEGTAKDPGAAWSFADVTAHYAQEFFGSPADSPVVATAGSPPASPASFQQELHQLDRHRAAAHHAVKETLTEWRRADSSCHGALILAARDLTPGPGFGLSDVLGVPKSTWYGFRSSCAATSVAVVDEGLNGVDIHLFHDTPLTLRATLTVTVHSLTGHVVAKESIPVELAGHESRSWPVAELLGGFRDYAYTWRFGEKFYDAMEVELTDEDNQVVAHTVHLLDGVYREPVILGLKAEMGADKQVLEVVVSTVQTASFVALDLPGYVPSENYFHLPAGSSRSLSLQPLPGPTGQNRALISGTVRALNDLQPPHQISHSHSSHSNSSTARMASLALSAPGKGKIQ